MRLARPIRAVAGLPSTIRANPGAALGWVLAAAALAAAAVTVGSTLHGIGRARMILPYQDEWELVGLMNWLAEHGFHWHIFMWQHNEHRLVLPRLLFLTDMYVFGFRGTFNLVAIQVIQALHAVMLWRLVCRSADWPAWTAVLAAGLVALAMFSAHQLENLTWGFQSQFVGVFALATAASWSIAASARALDAGETARSWIWLALSTVAAAGATYTLAGGLLAWPLLLVMAVLLRLPWTRFPLILVVAGLCLWRYFVDFHRNPGHADPVDSVLRHPLEMLEFTAAFLAFPLTDNDLDWTGVIAGAAVLAGAGLFVLAAVRGRRTFNTAQWALFGVCLFVIGFALATAAGRLNFGVMQAASSRYKTPALVFWIAAFGLFASVAWQSRGRYLRWLRWPVAAGIAAAAVSVYGEQLDSYDNFRGKQLFGRSATASLLLGVPDDGIYEKLYPSGPEVFARARRLRREGVSIYRNPEADWVGRPLTDSLTIAEEGACQGHFDGFFVPDLGDFRQAGRARFMGWAWDAAAEEAPRVVVGTDERGLVSALGYPGWARWDVAEVLGGRRYVETGWIGTAVGGPGTMIRAYAVLADGRACPLPGRHPVPD